MDRVRPVRNLWGAYWADAPPDSCAALLPDAARDEIERIWRGAFAEIKDGQSVLDIATGKGAVLTLAAEATRGVGDVTLLGVDRAPTLAIAPDEAKPRRRRILGDVDAGALPFADRSFTLVASQFGLEYAGFERALAEATRVCAQRLVLLVHAADGVIVRQNAAQADQISWVLDTLELFEKLKAYFQTSSNETRTTVEDTLKAIGKRSQAIENRSLLTTIHRGAMQLHQIAARQSGDIALQIARDMEARMRNHGARMAELGAVAPTAEACNDALRRLEENGFATCRLRDALAPGSGALVGRWIDAVR